MSEAFSRSELLLGADALERLSRARVAVFGIGGVGGHAAEALVRGGVGRLDLIDNDTVAVSNLNRQLFALRSTVGMPKVEAARQRLLDINPDLELRTEMMTVKNGDDGLSIVFKRDEAKSAFLDDEEEEQLYGED